MAAIIGFSRWKKRTSQQFGYPDGRRRLQSEGTPLVLVNAQIGTG
jgi:hypothetical protein